MGICCKQSLPGDAYLNYEFETDYRESIEESDTRQKKDFTFTTCTISEVDQNKTVNESTEPCIESNISDRKKINVDFEYDDRESTEERNTRQKVIFTFTATQSADKIRT